MFDIDFPNYVYENTPYVAADGIEDVIRKLANDSIKLYMRFSDNKMKVNKDKWHLIFSNNEHISINHKEYLDIVIKKPSQKVNVLSGVAPYMNVAKRRLMITFSFYIKF